MSTRVSVSFVLAVPSPPPLCVCMVAEGQRGMMGSLPNEALPSFPGKRTCKKGWPGPGVAAGSSGGAPGSFLTAGGPHPQKSYHIVVEVGISWSHVGIVGIVHVCEIQRALVAFPVCAGVCVCVCVCVCVIVVCKLQQSRYPWDLLQQVEPKKEMPSPDLEADQRGRVEANGPQSHPLRAPRGNSRV